MKKRILSFLLAAALVVSCTPLGAFAEDPADSEVTVIGGADGPTAIYVTEQAPADGQTPPRTLPWTRSR